MLLWWWIIIWHYCHSRWPGARAQPDDDLCRSQIYCNGTLLAAIQQAPLFEDSKRFVDMPSKFSEAEILERFRKLGNQPSYQILRQFVADNFYGPGYELGIVQPRDWQKEIPWFDRIKDVQLQKFARTVHAKWQSLVRRVDMTRLCKGCASSVIPLPHPFVIPGGRFRELYYWDSFWILEGLYVSNMCQTASDMLDNFRWLIETFGFIPNGSRSYYLNRSHPPLYPIMLQRYLEECIDPKNQAEQAKWLRKVLPFAETEYSFWMKHRLVEIPTNSSSIILNRYRADTRLPRPESYLEDILLGKEITGRGDGWDPTRLYREISSAAESGLDFTGRWFKDGKGNLTDMHTSSLVPIDLNAILVHNERALSELFAIIGDEQKSEIFKNATLERKNKIEAHLWDAERLAWMDFDLKAGQRVGTDMPFYLSSLSPLWHRAHNRSPKEISNILERYEEILSHQDGGIPFDESVTGQQWDYPNVWAPFQYYLILVYERLGEQLGAGLEGQKWRAKALNVAQRFLNSSYCGFLNFGQFFEKYNAQSVGLPGGGGEYVVQEGFGWTNGVTLWILKKYSTRLMAPQCRDLNPSIIVPEPPPAYRNESEFIAASDLFRGQTLKSVGFLMGIMVMVLLVYRFFNKS